MPIDLERFENREPTDPDEPTNAEQVMRFLARNDDQAWKPSAIAEQTGVADGSIGTVLARLHDRGLVRHRGEYWAVTDDRERLGPEYDPDPEIRSPDEPPERSSGWEGSRGHSRDDGTEPNPSG